MKMLASCGQVVMCCFVELPCGFMLPCSDQLTLCCSYCVSCLSIEQPKSWIDRDGDTRRLKQLTVSMIAALFMIYGITLLCVAVEHFRISHAHCHSVTEGMFNINGSTLRPPSDSEMKTLSSNPELFVWDQCLYKVYPFTNDEEHRCQCRVFVIDWESDLQSTASEREEYFNLTQETIMEGVLAHWSMLEKLKTSYFEESSVESNFSWTASVSNVHLKAVEWHNLKIQTIHRDVFMIWNQLEYFRIQNTFKMPAFPDSFGGLNKLRYLELDQSGIPELPLSICDLTNLEVVWVLGEGGITELPQCMDQLRNLRLLLVDICYVPSFPLPLLSLPNLVGFSMYQNNLYWDSLLDGNVPPDIDRNDTDSVAEWLDENFIFLDQNETVYFLYGNPICSENVSFLTPNISAFMDRACADQDVSTEIVFCSPWLLGNGVCNDECADVSLLFDRGDCMLSLRLVFKL